MWLEEYRVDGLRMDMIVYMRNVHGDESEGSVLSDGLTLLQWINGEVAAKYPWKITIAEDLHRLDSVTNGLDTYEGLGFGAQWDADFVHPVRAALIAQFDQDRNMDSILAALMRQYSGNAFKRVIYTESHDEVANGKSRVAEEIASSDVNNWYSKKRASLGIAMVLTAPGIPMIFQGHELLEDKWFSDTDPIDWKRVKKFNGFVKLHRDLIKLRLNYNNNTEGLSGQNTHVIRVDKEKKIIAYNRFQNVVKGDVTVVILNFSDNGYTDYRIGFAEPGLWKIRFNSDWDGYDKDFGDFETLDTEAVQGECDGMPFNANIAIAPYSAVILSQDRE